MDSKELREICRRELLIQKPVESRLFWNDSVQCVCTDKGLCVFEFSMNLNSIDKNIDTVASFVLCPKTSPAECVIPTEFMKTPINNVHFTQFIINPTLWPHNKNFVKDLAAIASCKWSPRDLINNNGHAIAVMNNLGSVNFFKQSRYGWTEILNLSDMIVKEFKSSDTDTKASDFEMVKNYCEVVETSSICWQPEMELHKSCFVTAQKNGNIMFWKIESEAHKLNAQLHDVIQSDITGISNLLWISKKDNEFSLICCAVSGEVYNFMLQIECNKISVIKSTVLWKHHDRMTVRHLEYACVDDHIVIIYTKHRYLVVQLLDFQGNVVSEYVNNVNDYTLTTLLKNCGHFYVSTIDCKIYEIIISINNYNLSISLSEVMFKDTYTNYQLHNFCLSPNNVLLTLNLKNKEIPCRKTSLKIELVYLIFEDNDMELSLLLNNPSEKLTYMYDCIEVIRCKSIKNKLMPKIDYVRLYLEAQENVYKMRLYLMFTTLYNTLFNVSHGTLPDFPEKSVEKIKDMILCKHAITLFNNVIGVYEICNKSLSETQSEILMASYNFLKHYCFKYKDNINKYIDENSFSKIDVKFSRNKCMCCEEELIGLTCKDNHVNQFCVLTFRAIGFEDYLVCKACSAICRSDLYPQKPMCVFCDLYMEDYFIPR